MKVRRNFRCELWACRVQSIDKDGYDLLLSRQEYCFLEQFLQLPLLPFPVTLAIPKCGAFLVIRLPHKEADGLILSKELVQ
jgi:hypothetical protein